MSRVAASIRAAVLTASPITVKSSRPPPPTLPATTEPGVDADADLEVALEPVARLPRDRERGLDRAVGVVAAGRGRAEHGQQPVAHELVHVAAALG